MKLYKREFPDFDYELPDVPGFDDDSWHNDVCPKMTRETGDGRFQIWFDYKNPELRELHGHQYYFAVTNDVCTIELLHTDDFDRILKLVHVLFS